MSADKMRKLMESVEPTMMPEEWPQEQRGIKREMDDDMAPSGIEGPDDIEMGDEMMAPEGGDASVIDELDAEFKRITTEYLQADGPLDAPEHADMRKKLTDHMKKMLDELHDGWMDDMMGDDGAHDDSGDTPEFFGGTDDDDEDDSEDTAAADDDSEADDDDSETETDADDDAEEADDSDDDDDSDDSDDDDGEDKGNNPFQFNESRDSAANMRKLMETLKKG